MSSELTKLDKQLDKMTYGEKEVNIPEIVKNVWEHRKSLIWDIDRVKLVDGHDGWREKEARDLSDLVHRRFDYLQNPKDCNKAKKLLCNLNKGCGFGCQVGYFFSFPYPIIIISIFRSITSSTAFWWRMAPNAPLS